MRPRPSWQPAWCSRGCWAPTWHRQARTPVLLDAHGSRLWLCGVDFKLISPLPGTPLRRGCLCGPDGPAARASAQASTCGPGRQPASVGLRLVSLTPQRGACSPLLAYIMRSYHCSAATVCTQAHGMHTYACLLAVLVLYFALAWSFFMWGAAAAGPLRVPRPHRAWPCHRRLCTWAWHSGSGTQVRLHCTRATGVTVVKDTHAGGARMPRIKRRLVHQQHVSCNT